jgi:hypothetical protein
MSCVAFALERYTIKKLSYTVPIVLQYSHLDYPPTDFCEQAKHEVLPSYKIIFETGKQGGQPSNLSANSNKYNFFHIYSP